MINEKKTPKKRECMYNTRFVVYYSNSSYYPSSGHTSQPPPPHPHPLSPQLAAVATAGCRCGSDSGPAPAVCRRATPAPTETPGAGALVGVGCPPGVPRLPRSAWSLVRGAAQLRDGTGVTRPYRVGVASGVSVWTMEGRGERGVLVGVDGYGGV